MSKRVYKGPSEHNNVLSYSGWARVRRTDEELLVETKAEMDVVFRHNVWYLYDFVTESFDGLTYNEVSLRNGRNFVRLSRDQFEDLFITKGICDY